MPGSSPAYFYSPLFCPTYRLYHHVEVLRRAVIGLALPVVVEVAECKTGDAAWLARRRSDGQEFMLDMVLERKSVGDLVSSIKDSRRVKCLGE